MKLRWALTLTLIVSLLCNVCTMAQNTLSKKEKKHGWKLLFDGKTTTGWRNYNRKSVGEGWKVQDGALTIDTNVTDREERGDLITHDEYENFECSLEWKIDSCGNSGIMYNVVEDPKFEETYLTGPEMQVLDNACHPDAKIEKHRAGDLYDLIKCKKETVKPAGEWNEVKIVSDHARYEFWLNGTKVVEFTMHTPEWDALVAASKFKDMPAFGKATTGHIALQDHGNKVWFRNIKIREIK